MITAKVRLRRTRNAGKHPMNGTAGKLTLARKIAAITLALWKNKEVYDPAKTSKTS